MLCTDGAQCYVKQARELKVQHFQCNHSQNQFVLRKRRRSGALSVHTGTIDNAWRLLKQAVPKSLASKKGHGHTYNSALIKHCRSWQWRWENTGTSLFEKTGKVLNETVQSGWLSLAIEKNARRNVLKPAYFKKTAKKWRWFWKLMNAENIAKRKKKPKRSGTANIMNWNVCQKHAFRIQCLAYERQEQTKLGFSFPPGGMF